MLSRYGFDLEAIGKTKNFKYKYSAFVCNFVCINIRNNLSWFGSWICSSGTRLLVRTASASSAICMQHLPHRRSCSYEIWVLRTLTLAAPWSMLSRSTSWRGVIWMKTSRSSSSFSVSVHGFRLRFFPAWVKDNSKPERLVVSRVGTCGRIENYRRESLVPVILGWCSLSSL